MGRGEERAGQGCSMLMDMGWVVRGGKPEKRAVCSAAEEIKPRKVSETSSRMMSDCMNDEW
jgi:hypothetical protein